MKKSFRVLFIAIVLSAVLLSCSNYDFSKKFSTVPEKPKQGDVVTILFNAKGTALENADKIDMVVYSFSNDLDNTSDYEMTKSGKGWIGKVQIPDSIFGMTVKFVSDNETESNGKEGFVIYTYNSNGEPRPESVAGWANFNYKYGYYAGIEFDPETVYNLFGKALVEKPDLKNDFFYSYLISKRSALGEEVYSELLNEMDEYVASDNIKEEDYPLLISYYTRLGNPAKSDELRKEALEKYPEGQMAQRIEFSKFRALVNPEEMISFYENFNKKFPNSDYLDYMRGSINNAYINLGDYDGAAKYLTRVSETTSNDYNILAWNMYQNNVNLDKALKYAQTGIEFGRKEVKSPSNDCPIGMTENEWLKNRQKSLAYILDTYAVIAEKLNMNEEALKTEKESFELTGGKEKEITENYSEMLINSGKYVDATEILEKAIATGESTSGMKDLLAKAYTAKNGSDEGFDEYLGELEETAQGKIFAETKKKMIKEPAPEFSLNDTEGNRISLGDLKGKTVIIDFWATWCGPCKASFPAMKKVVEKYADNDKVAFLFVNTWENVDDKLSNAKQFIKSNNYPFHVLMDLDNKVISAFKVSGIPTKFILDGNGNIRFKSVGYGGDDDALISEMDTMIKLASK